MATQITIISDQSVLVGFPEWPIPTLALQAGKPGFDLKPTLPTGVPVGGTFGTKAPLPSGASVTTDGVVSVAAGTPSFTANNIEFTYTLP